MRLIIIDGLDATGKDTHAQLIKKKYEENGKKVIVRSHPSSDNFFGINAKKALLGKGRVYRVLASFFYMMDVLRSVKKYFGAKNYDTLIIVRYLMGTAYLPLPLAKIAYTFFANFVPTSRYMFFLDASPKELLKRVKKRKNVEMFETLDELVKVRTKALALANECTF